MKFSDVENGRRFQVGEGSQKFGDPFTKIAGGFSIDGTFAVYSFPSDLTVTELTESEQPQQPV